MTRPTIAVHKFSSCDGCQLAFLNAGEDLLELAGLVDIKHFLEAGGLADEDAEVDIAFVEGSMSTAEEVERISARARQQQDGRHAGRLCNGRRPAGTAQPRRPQRRLEAGGVRPTGVHRHAGTRRTDRRPCQGRLRAGAARSTGARCWLRCVGCCSVSHRWTLTTSFARSANATTRYA